MKKKKLTDPPSDFAKIFRSFGHSHRPYRIFSDFCTMAACAIANSMREFQPKELVERREKEYLDCAAQYDKDELSKFCEMLTAVTIAFEENQNQDFLGAKYMELELYNDRTGQYFTPYNVSLMMARMIVGDPKKILEKQDFITIQDQCIGGGAMLIAGFNALKEIGINPQTQCLFYGQDIDPTVLRMAYVQCSLLGMSGHFMVGNSIFDEVLETFTTPMYYLNWWRFRRKEKEALEMEENAEKPVDEEDEYLYADFVPNYDEPSHSPSSPELKTPLPGHRLTLFLE